jgi:RNA polymerase sigma factor (sigma-70 family)
MSNPAFSEKGSTFALRCPVEAMASETSTATSLPNGADDLFESLVSGQRGRALRAQLASNYPDLSADAIEDAIQYACKSFLDEAEGITAPGQVYVWIRTAAHRSLAREVDHHKREVSVDPAEDGWRLSAEEVGPVEELIDLEDDADLELLVEEVSSSLSDRRRHVLALYGAGLKRPQIADRLGVPERVVKRDLREIMDAARVTLARLAGGGCEHGEPLVMRLIFGISTPDESSAAREHLAHCERCDLFSERLIGWREKAGAMLPAPVAEGASPGVVRQIADAAGDKISSLKQHVLEGGAQLKQHAAATSSRAVDPTPVAGARPGTAVAVIAGCLAIGGGAAGVCVEQGVDPLGAASGLIASAPDEEAPGETTTPPPEAESTGPTYMPETPVEEPAPAPEPSPEPTPEPQPEPESKPEAAAPENSFEPASSPTSQSSATESEASYEATEESAPAPQPAPAAPSNGSQQFQP